MGISDFSYSISSGPDRETAAWAAKQRATLSAMQTADRIRGQHVFGGLPRAGVAAEAGFGSFEALGLGGRAGAGLRALGLDPKFALPALKIGGTIGLIDFAMGKVEQIGNAATELANEFRAGRMTFGTAMQQVVMSMPVLGSSIRAGLSVGRAFVGEIPKGTTTWMGDQAMIDAEKAIRDEQAARARQAEEAIAEQKRRVLREQFVEKAMQDAAYRRAGEEGIHQSRMQELREQAEERAAAVQHRIGLGLGARSAKLEAAAAAVGAGLMSPRALLQMQLAEELSQARFRGASEREQQLIRARAGLTLMGMNGQPVEGGVPTTWNPSVIGRGAGDGGGRVAENTATTNRLLEEANRFLRELASTASSGGIDL